MHPNLTLFCSAITYVGVINTYGLVQYLVVVSFSRKSLFPYVCTLIHSERYIHLLCVRLV